ncbi:Hypothetical protein FKW44_021928 [Caligus rogercresseyi]|uniref:Uncharacterized protein n=1 Tax=Caligus rogercresseyi TaxID=217165 RepID=A0A7T8GS15_CALRO|nr:Hypothetical protein FKW44_021928 [Caligus rogercresseyi]
MDRMADEYSRMKQALLSDLLDDEEEDEIEEDLEATEEDRPRSRLLPRQLKNP